MSPRAHPPGSRQACAGPLLEVGGLWLLTLFCGVLLIAGLLHHVRQQELQALERAQLALTLLEIEAGLELDLSSGLDLDHNRHIQPLLESSRAKDAQLYSLDVLDADGRTLFSTDRGIVGERLPPAVLAAARHAAGAQQQTWHGQIAGTPIMGVALHGPFDEPTGHVSASYASRSHAADRALIPSVVIALLAMALAGSAAVWLATRAQRQLLRQQARGRLAQVHGQLHAARQRLDHSAQRLDAVEHIE